MSLFLIFHFINYSAAPMMQPQGWGVMPTAATAATSQYAQLAQNPQGYNGKS